MLRLFTIMSAKYWRTHTQISHMKLFKLPQRVDDIYLPTNCLVLSYIYTYDLLMSLCDFMHVEHGYIYLYILLYTCIYIQENKTTLTLPS